MYILLPAFLSKMSQNVYNIKHFSKRYDLKQDRYRQKQKSYCQKGEIDLIWRK